MSAAAIDLFALEAKMPDGATVAIPAELLEAVQASCIVKIDDDAKLAAGRDAFVRRFLAELFARDLLLVPRGRPTGRETVGLDAYSLVCSQKHALQAEGAELGARLAAIAGTVAASDDRADLVDELEAAVASLVGRAPRGGAARIAGVDERVREIRRLAFNLPDAEASELAAEAGAGGVK